MADDAAPEPPAPAPAPEPPAAPEPAPPPQPAPGLSVADVEALLQRQSQEQRQRRSVLDSRTESGLRVGAASYEAQYARLAVLLPAAQTLVDNPAKLPVRTMQVFAPARSPRAV
jgi:hypothetical protein